jgi:broad specificity phosphatase PhoE
LVFLLSLLLSTPVASQQRAGAARSTLRIYLARHGQTDWNLQGRTQGGIDIELNATGREQAQLLKMRVSDLHLDAVYSSTLRRSRETAEIVHGNIPLTSLPGLGERRFGKFEGGSSSDPDLLRRRWIPDDALDGGESLNVLRERVRTTLDTIRKQHSSGSILIVGHDYMNRMLLSVLVGLTVEQMQQFDQANDELYLIELEVGNPPRLWKLITQSNIKDL